MDRYSFGLGWNKCTQCGSICRNRGCKNTRRVICSTCWAGYVGNHGVADANADAQALTKGTFETVADNTVGASGIDAEVPPGKVRVAQSCCRCSWRESNDVNLSDETVIVNGKSAQVLDKSTCSNMRHQEAVRPRMFADALSIQSQNQMAPVVNQLGQSAHQNTKAYIVVCDALPVTASEGTAGARLAKLSKNTLVEVFVGQMMAVDGRWRAPIVMPAGWISVSMADDSQTFAVQADASDTVPQDALSSRKVVSARDAAASAKPVRVDPANTVDAETQLVKLEKAEVALLDAVRYRKFAKIREAVEIAKNIGIDPASIVEAETQLASFQKVVLLEVRSASYESRASAVRESAAVAKQTRQLLVTICHLQEIVRQKQIEAMRAYKVAVKMRAYKSRTLPMKFARGMVSKVAAGTLQHLETISESESESELSTAYSSSRNSPAHSEDEM